MEKGSEISLDSYYATSDGEIESGGPRAHEDGWAHNRARSPSPPRSHVFAHVESKGKERRRRGSTGSRSKGSTTFLSSWRVSKFERRDDTSSGSSDESGDDRRKGKNSLFPSLKLSAILQTSPKTSKSTRTAVDPHVDGVVRIRTVESEFGDGSDRASEHHSMESDEDEPEQRTTGRTAEDDDERAVRQINYFGRFHFRLPPKERLSLEAARRFRFARDAGGDDESGEREGRVWSRRMRKNPDDEDRQWNFWNWPERRHRVDEKEKDRPLSARLPGVVAAAAREAWDESRLVANLRQIQVRAAEETVGGGAEEDSDLVNRPTPSYLLPDGERDEEGHEVSEKKFSVLVFCYSLTGNTLYIAKRIVQELKRHDVMTVSPAVNTLEFAHGNRDASTFCELLRVADVLIVGSLTVSWRPPWHFYKFLRDLDPMLFRGKRAAIFTTSYNNDGATKSWIDHLLREKQCRCVSHVTIWSPDSCFLAKFPKIQLWGSEEHQVKVAKWVEGRLLPALRSSRRKPGHRPPRRRLKGAVAMVQSDRASRFFMGGVIKLDPTLCTRCYKCVSVCPNHAWTRVESEDVTFPVYKKDDCVMCCRCINFCPPAALSHKYNRGKIPYHFQSSVLVDGKNRLVDSVEAMKTYQQRMARTQDSNAPTWVKSSIRTPFSIGGQKIEGKDKEKKPEPEVTVTAMKENADSTSEMISLDEGPPEFNSELSDDMGDDIES